MSALDPYLAVVPESQRDDLLAAIRRNADRARPPSQALKDELAELFRPAAPERREAA